MLESSNRWKAVTKPLHAFARDVTRVVNAARSEGSKRPTLAAVADSSLWALALLRASAAMRAATGSSLGLSTALRVLFHIDVWTDDIGGGLRLPHPFCVVVGGGVQLEDNCTLMHNVTIQHSRSARIGTGTVLGAGVVVLADAQVGERCLVGANSVVRGEIPAGHVAVGAPARAVRAVRESEVSR